MQASSANHYATLGLDHGCTLDQIRAAYRILAKQFHPDVNPSAEAKARTQEINAAYETLRDPQRRQAYDVDRAAPKQKAAPNFSGKVERNVAKEVHLRIEDFFKGTALEIRIDDPGNPDGPETYEWTVPPTTPPGTRFRVPRAGYFNGGFVLLRVRARPDFRFKVRGSDLRCDLRISPQRAAQGGSELVQGPLSKIRVQIPKGVGRNAIVRVNGEGLPKTRGGRGDLLVRITYKPEIQITKSRR